METLSPDLKNKPQCPNDSPISPLLEHTPLRFLTLTLILRSMWYNESINRRNTVPGAGVFIINEPQAAFAQCQAYCSSEQVESIFFLQELSSTVIQ